MGLSHNAVQETYFLYHGNIQVLFLNLAKQPHKPEKIIQITLQKGEKL